MGGLERFQRFIKANVNHWLTHREEPEQALERLIVELQEQLCALRQAVAVAIATQKRLDRQSRQAKRLAEDWYTRAEQSLEQNREDLAWEALARRKTYQNSNLVLQTQRQTQLTLATQMKQQLAKLEARVFEAKTQKDLLVARARSAEAAERLYHFLNQVDSRAPVFERMEDKVINLESSAAAIAEMSAQQLENQIEALGQADDIDAELTLLKQKFQ